jgi:NADH-quinone oxidoreductase subunit A
MAGRLQHSAASAGEGDMLWPLVVYFGLVMLLVAVMIGLSALLGERHTGRAAGDPYEAGILSTGGARLHLSVKFYLVAVFFVVFDVEAAFLFAWAVAVRELAWVGYVEALVFIGILVAALAYLWRAGALDWNPKGKREKNGGKDQAQPLVR